MALNKVERRKRIKMRVRKNIFGTKETPRLSVFRSNKEIYVQFVDDTEGKTLLSFSSRNKEVAEKKGVTKTEKARMVGKLAAEKILETGVSQVKFDRNGYLYHGRIKALAEAAREGGLKF